MASLVHTLLLASLTSASCGAPPIDSQPSIPTMDARKAVEYGATALNFTASVLAKTRAAPSGRSPRSDAALLRKLGSELLASYDEKGTDSADLAKTALALGMDALKLGAQVMSSASPSGANVSTYQKPGLAHARGDGTVGAHGEHTGVPLALARSSQDAAHHGVPRSAAHSGSERSRRTAKAPHAAAPQGSAGARPLALGRVGSHAALESMDDLPMGGGFLSGRGSGSPFGRNAVVASTPEKPPSLPARPPAVERPHFHAVTPQERTKAKATMTGLV